MTIVKFDKVTARTLQAEALVALQAVAEKHGLSVIQHGGQIGDIDFVAKFQFKVADKAAVEDAARSVFRQYCSAFGLRDEHFGAEFRSGGRTFQVAGLDLNRRTKPLRARDVANGKDYIFRAEDVRRLLAA